MPLVLLTLLMKLVADHVDAYYSQRYEHPVSAIKVLKSECAQIEARFYKKINGLERKGIGFCHIFAF